MKKVNCKKACRLLSAYADGELPAPLQQAVKEHLQGCSSCAEKLAAVTGVSRVLGEMPGATLTGEEKAEMRAGIRSAMEQYRPAPARRVFSFRTAVMASTAMMVVVALTASLVVLWRQDNGIRQTARDTTAGEAMDGGAAPYAAPSKLAALPEAQVVSTGRVLSRPDLDAYGADYGQRLLFYSFFWEGQVEQGTWVEREELVRLQAEYVAAMGETAQFLGEDPSALAASLWMAMQAAGEPPLLPCYAELVVFDGRAAWLVSLSGPGDVALFEEAEELETQTLDATAQKMIFVIDAADFRILY
jgi:hypothetical protein